MSPGLWVQMLGRGMRMAPDKKNCLVLDFAGNTRRLGPINDPVIPRKKGAGRGDVPIKVCEACGTYNHIRVEFCIECGEQFTFEIKITPEAATSELLRSSMPIIEYFDVKRVVYSKHLKIGSPPILRVSYYCGLHAFHEYILLEHEAYASKRARDWWRERDATWPNELPITVDDALKMTNRLEMPRAIRVHVNARHPRIIGYDFNE